MIERSTNEIVTGYSNEHLDCAIETSSHLLQKHRHQAPYQQEEIKEALHSSKFCNQLSQQQLEVVVAYIHGLAPKHLNHADKIIWT
ncbi:hypothetical protein [Pseudanabaena sp. SR411]|uniref:hypothetical protein n=1 Tax=Pseudanabaena sp. SR411 TaxID=1980935 RepID=UPI0011407AA3|nr:hypothetical protein [Pseudanabaena sp. SR411]